ncbi:para-aminobenzoate synthetase [Tremella mesenterica]|uniref:aminodeoxychorismate synthase n=1 Tax=Tremella mesenterica TaxID=5217 RepID=A0A4Q1BKT8_TREME|nr:para-aminobenzoate synthetase [Tremella mesenterica]
MTSASTIPIPPLPRTVILDYYDSYTNNLLTLFTQLYSDEEVLKKVVVVKADRYTWDEFQTQVIPSIDCIILSPGPGRPDTPSDIGFALDLLRLHPVPILGVCLGHQAIGVAFGGKIINTPRISHGHVIPVKPVLPALGLFDSPVWKNSGIEDVFKVVVYNSLTIEPETLPEDLEVTAWSALDEERRTIQGIRHKSYPIWGVQYHPESISSTHGSVLLHAFLDNVHRNNSRPVSYNLLPEHILNSCSYRIAAVKRQSNPYKTHATPPLPTPPISRPASQHSFAESSRISQLSLVEKPFGDLGRDVPTELIFHRLIRSRKGKERIGDIWLDGKTVGQSRCLKEASPSFVITYSLSSRSVALHLPDQPPSKLVLPAETTFWEWFGQGHEEIYSSLVSSDQRRRGWQGGWVGWFGYEMKVESLQGYRKDTLAEGEGEIDACWAWCDRILERTSEGDWIARGLVADPINQPPTPRTAAQDDQSKDLTGWLGSLGVTLGISPTQFDDFEHIASLALQDPDQLTLKFAPGFPSFRPIDNATAYTNTISSCREAIRQGESYELTLTTQFEACCPTSNDPFSLYLRLRTFNPAYYSSFLSFPSLVTPRGRGVHVLSSSPERFLKTEQGRVEMMPIKGTRAREAQREDHRRGEELEADEKERAENLMIVDLIRSDLLGCCIPSTVKVPKLIALESYGVHNLVTTVEGMLADNVGQVEAVKRCFPPGSMTGAPKLRSVQLLDDFESHRRRGIYSGALGYLSVDGSTDLSVVIRTMIIEGDHMSLGAGGAITWLSDNDMEWEEVLTKVRSVVGNLDVDKQAL